MMRMITTVQLLWGATSLEGAGNRECMRVEVWQIRLVCGEKCG